MGYIKQSISWWCFAKLGMTIEGMARLAAEIGYEALELVEPEHWQAIKDHGLAIASVRGQSSIEEGFNRREHHAHLEREVRSSIAVIHDIDAVRWFLGQEITNVYAQGVRTHLTFSDETLDMLLLQMTVSGECLATVEVSVAMEYGYEVSGEIVGERGTALTTQPGLTLMRSQEARSVAVSTDGLAYFQEAYVSELTSWVRAIQTGQTFPGANAWDGYMSLLVSDACIQSLRRRVPISVPTPVKPDFYQARN